MSLIHTCELNGVNPLDYLTQLQRHAAELSAHPAEWMSWTYRKTLAQRMEIARSAVRRNRNCGTRARPAIRSSE
jgi:hypothetical protein